MVGQPDLVGDRGRPVVRSCSNGRSSRRRLEADAPPGDASVGLVLGIAALSISLEYLVDFCVGDVTDPSRPAGDATVAGDRRQRPPDRARPAKAVLRRPPDPATAELGAIAGAIDWVAAADNYSSFMSTAAR